MFKMINALLSTLVERAAIAGLIFKFFTRILPVPTAEVRGVRIKIVAPLNQYGVFSTFRTWETREPETLDWIDSFEEGSVFFDVGAGFGTETLYAALKKRGPRKIVCFDRDLSSSLNLASNLQLNQIRNVDQYYMALGSDSVFVEASEHTNYASVRGLPKYNRVSYKPYPSLWTSSSRCRVKNPTT